MAAALCNVVNECVGAQKDFGVQQKGCSVWYIEVSSVYTVECLLSVHGQTLLCTLVSHYYIPLYTWRKVPGRPMKDPRVKVPLYLQTYFYSRAAASLTLLWVLFFFFFRRLLLF